MTDFSPVYRPGIFLYNALPYPWRRLYFDYFSHKHGAVVASGDLDNDH